MQIVFVHPDLGIGGAERLVVDAALALQSKGHRVNFVTGHHDRKHCFEETKDGTFFVNVIGEWIPRQVFGRFHALLAYLRMIYIAIYLVAMSSLKPDVIFCDQVSVCVPILRWGTSAKVVFYCHFPDQLLTDRNTFLKTLYRIPLDWLEEKSTGLAHLLLVNSNFTEQIFKDTFKTLSHMETHVLHPSLNTTAYDKALEKPLRLDASSLPSTAKHIFLSINRYERKKKIRLAIEALDVIRDRVTAEQWEKVHLIIAGGYDERLEENVSYHKELVRLAGSLDVRDKVSFFQSISNQKKYALFHTCTAVLYTPINEHFGIVPVEAMYMKKPVIGVNSGGPLETIADGETGFLRDPNPESFALTMIKFIKKPELAGTMGAAGHRRVKQKFSFDAFATTLNGIIQSIAG